MELYWIGYEWKHENESLFGSTICGIDNEKISYEDYGQIAEQIKKEVYEENPVFSLLAEGPFITCAYRLKYNSKLFQGEETAFAISYIAKTKQGTSIRAQVCIKVSLKFKNLTDSSKNLIIAFSYLLKEIRKKAEYLSGETFEEFQIYYIYELEA